MKRPRSRLFGLPALLGATLIGGGLPRAEAAPPGPAVVVRTLSEQGVEGTLSGLDKTHVSVREAGAATDRRLPLAEVIELRPAGAKSRPDPGAKAAEEVRLRARLVGGSELVGLYRGPAEDGVVLDVDGLGNVSLGFERMSSLDSLPPYSGDMSRRCPRPKSGDLAYDVNDDEFAGVVYEADAANLVMEVKRERKRSIPWQRLRALHLESPPLEKPTGLRAEVELRNGSRLAVSGPITLTQKGLRFALRAEPEKQRDAAFLAVHAVRWMGGAFDYATMVPFTAVYKGYYGDDEGLGLTEIRAAQFGARVDRREDSSNGPESRKGPLELNGRVHRYGFGVNSHSTITLELGGSYRSFRAKFGIDDVVLAAPGAARGNVGNVDARILGDGKELWKAADVRGGQPAREVGPLDVVGVKQLVLEVGFGKDTGELDRADWVEPILVRK